MDLKEISDQVMAETTEKHGIANTAECKDTAEAQEAVICGSCSSFVKHFCLTCSVRLCDNCKSIHNSTHKIVLFVKKYSRELELCPSHKQVFQVFCKTCDDLACIKCLILKHKGHALVEIEEKYEEEKKKLKAETEDIKLNVLRGVRLSIDENKANVSEMLRRFDEMRKSATDEANLAKKIIDQGLHDNLSEISNLEGDFGSFLNDQQHALTTHLNLIENDVKNREERIKDETPITFLLGIMTNDKREIDYTMIPEGVKVQLPTFQRKITIESSNEVLRVASGSISSVDTSTMERKLLKFVPPPLPKYWKDDIEMVKTLPLKEMVHGENLRQVKHTTVGNIWITDERNAYQINGNGDLVKKITVSTKENCEIDSLCSDRDGYLIVSHICVNECSIGTCILNVETRAKSPINLLELPSGICLMDNKIVALVLIFRFGSTLKLKYYDDDGNAENTLVTLDKKLNSLLLVRKSLVNAICPCALSFNTTNKQVVISNVSNGIVAGSSMEGKYQFHYDGKHPCLNKEFRPIGVECDHYGHVLIVDTLNHCVHMLNKNGQFLTIIASKEHGLEFPYGLSIDKRGLLWITNLFQKTIEIIKYLEEDVPPKE